VVIESTTTTTKTIGIPETTVAATIVGSTSVITTKTD
jgi:hypothetical protein